MTTQKTAVAKAQTAATKWEVRTEQRCLSCGCVPDLPPPAVSMAAGLPSRTRPACRWCRHQLPLPAPLLPALQNEYKGCSKKKDPTCGDCPKKLQTCDVSLKQAQSKLGQQDQLMKVRGGPRMGSARVPCRQEVDALHRSLPPPWQASLTSYPCADAPPACPSNFCSQVKDKQLAELRKQLDAATATIAVSCQ